MSSLQQALDNAANKFNLKKLGVESTSTSKQKGSGEFESCFAQGLDISELISGPKSASQRTSAAEELLKIKQDEKRQRQIQEEEEQQMQVALQKKLNTLKQSTKSTKPIRSSLDIGDALVRMHGSDEISASVLSQKATHRKGNGASSRRRNSRPNHRSKKPLIATKKSRKSKF